MWVEEGDFGGGDLLVLVAFPLLLHVCHYPVKAGQFLLSVS